ncbi:hypothetical protein NIES2100_47610 [Calothrix sp. NIES-2100]|uniref:hypothetical protein n=1 Tax=Calothrix sp. NIES-2100 TaxID=1954172 RepID=UPI000B5F6B65|nr:hypothetical protein NIES2100_47610 [Calothrix sp. NIES-2100]
MSDREQDNFDISDNDQILDKLQEIVSRLQSVNNHQIDLPQLNKTEEDLQNLLPQIQFALVNAQEEKLWEQVNKLRQAARECQDTLNSIRAAIFRKTIININPANLTEMQKILQEIKTASDNQQKIDYIVYLLRFMRKLVF